LLGPLEMASCRDLVVAARRLALCLVGVVHAGSLLLFVGMDLFRVFQGLPIWSGILLVSHGITLTRASHLRA
jgi:hypothetical protein